MSTEYVETEYIECDDGCGYIGKDFIADYNSQEGREALKKRGFDVSNANHLSHIQTMFSGYICPSCGKFDSVKILPRCKPEDELEEKVVHN